MVRGKRSKRSMRHRLDRRGQSLIEFAFALPVVLLLIAAVFEFSRHYYTRISIRNAVAEAARFAATGQQLTDSISGDPIGRAESIVEVMRQNAAGLDLDVDRIVIDPADGGGPDDIVNIRATYHYEFMGAAIVRSFAPAYVEFTIATTIKNEPAF
jgi:hypothetical protein